MLEKDVTSKVEENCPVWFLILFSVWRLGFVIGLATGQLRIEFGGSQDPRDSSVISTDGPWVINKGDHAVVYYYQNEAVRKEEVPRERLAN